MDAYRRYKGVGSRNGPNLKEIPTNGHEWVKYSSKIKEILVSRLGTYNTVCLFAFSPVGKLDS